MTRLVRAEEFACPCSACNQSNHIDLRLVDRLDYSRKYANIPFIINSGYRCEAHNTEIGGSTNSAHMLGLAADIRAETSGQRYLILNALMHNGFKRIGIYKTFIHADMATVSTHGQDVIWYGG